MNNICNFFSKVELSKKEQEKKEKLIYNHLLNNVFFDSNNFRLNKKNIKESFKIFDKIYFENSISDNLKKINAKIYFKVNNRLYSTAGRCEYYHLNDKWEFGIVISSKIINNLFISNEKSLKINGKKCYSKIDCYISLFQHELIHLIIYIYCISKGKKLGGHTSTFKKLAFNIFGHKEYKHNLLSGDADELEKDELKFKSILKKGFLVKTKKIKNIHYKGIIYNLTPKYVYIQLSNGLNYKFKYCMIAKILDKDIYSDDNIKHKLKLGDIIKFKYKNIIKEGKILKLNKKTIKILQDKKFFYVPYHLIILNS